MEQDIGELIYSKEVVEFITVANQFCSFLENITDYTKEIFVEQSLKIGSLIYLKTSILPVFEKLYDGSPEKFVGEIDWELIGNQVAVKLGEDDLYIDLFLPKNIVQDQGEEISFSEGIADIYQDLKNTTTNYQIGAYEAINDSLWECKNNFEMYWGPRILAIMSGFHNLKYNSYMHEEKTATPEEKENLKQQFLDFQKPED